MIDINNVAMARQGLYRFDAISEYRLQTHCLSANGYAQNKATTTSAVYLWFKPAAHLSGNLPPHHRDLDFAYRPSNDHESSPPSDDLHEKRHRDRRIEPQDSR